MSAGADDRRSLAVAFKTLGCKVNRVESDSIAADLLGRGCRVVSEDEAAVIVVNTCTVTGEADAKARKAVRHALKAAGEPMVVVTGCLAAIDAEALRALGERVVVEADKDAVAAHVAAALALDAADASLHAALAPTARTGEGFRTRVAVKIQDGCDNFCTYCIVPHARGVPRSVPAERVAAEVEALVADGVAEVVLTGINLGRYGDDGLTLPGLIAQLSKSGVTRLRLSSIEPPDVNDELLAVMVENADIVCPHLHVPLQSGSDAVLAAMGRRYTTAEYLARITAARQAIPGLAVTTDVIAGFPGETDEDHARTIELCERAEFSRLHVFRYSRRDGTPAAASSGQITPEVKAARADELRELDSRLRTRFASSRVGTTTEVLIERITQGFAEGTTREYLGVRVPGGNTRVGDVVRVTLDAGSMGVGQDGEL